MTTPTTFHFTLGPVQGFVAQARRTRDFWAGSFLLSWLAGAAMQAVKEQGGEIKFPKPEDGYLHWLTGKGQGEAPRQGCIPNRFKAIQAKVPSDFDPLKIEQAVCGAWLALAEAVWQRDLQPHVPDPEQARAIWERQCAQFWDIAWALGNDDALLDRRKNWRTQLPPDEAGVKCSMMAGWQELSGATHPKDERLTAFWKPFREPLRKEFNRDFDPDEALCAIAFIKRRFVKGFADLRVSMPGGWTLHGWRVDGQMPSTLDLAAAHWVAQLNNVHEDVLKSLAATVELLLEVSPLLGTSDGGLGKLRCVRDTGQESLKRLHSSALFAHVLDNRKLCPDRERVKAVRQALKALGQATPPSPFYAILRMDGDSLGQLLQSDPEAPPKISEALNTFTAAVPKIVDDRNGFLIYAGGDDVLALLPLEDALGCATAIRASYLAAFRQAFHGDGRSTISAAVTFAHVKIPLTRMLRDSHQLLDDIAKDATGRDALAVRVAKASGEALQWARPWEKAFCQTQPHRLEIECLADDFANAANRSADATDRAAFSSKFFYKIRERFEFLNPSGDPSSALFNEQDARSLLAVDYLASGVNDGRRDKLKIADAERLIAPLLEQCHPVTRLNDAGSLTFPLSNCLEPDGALLVRFLAQKGVETQ
ncbi:type III-B CRISPR-associated protein Cas10/Cmr2 [Thiocystis violascens]|uniref:CRISPR-associated protein, Cmr2 family n=1 Tax=Thiocystis violascens (strain ATCC 17096 / DSM 198 / 6111) TaxID=765911 RepID=I3YH48_THIV6|nr:type III-B CRISPR-associated protein Cas10/Cmr2 [Thiocystis violascens]AFL76316.1 CRISPR-associated protein, Cmr2 family [Thiocystis violascens DSM 198]